MAVDLAFNNIYKEICMLRKIIIRLLLVFSLMAFATFGHCDDITSNTVGTGNVNVPHFDNGDNVDLKGLILKNIAVINICASSKVYIFESGGVKYHVAGDNEDVNKTFNALRGTKHTVQIHGIYKNPPVKKCNLILVDKAEHISGITAKINNYFRGRRLKPPAIWPLGTSWSKGEGLEGTNTLPTLLD